MTIPENQIEPSRPPIGMEEIFGFPEPNEEQAENIFEAVEQSALDSSHAWGVNTVFACEPLADVIDAFVENMVDGFAGESLAGRDQIEQMVIAGLHAGFEIIAATKLEVVDPFSDFEIPTDLPVQE